MQIPRHSGSPQVQEAWDRYEQVAKALAQQCAPETLGAAGIHAYDHLSNFITLNHRKYATAITLIDTCEWVLDRHITWLRPAIAQTACPQRRLQMDSVAEMIVDIYKDLVSERRMMEKNAGEFRQWATQTYDDMEKLRYHEADIFSAFDDIRAQVDIFNMWVEEFRRRSSRSADEDE